MSVEFPGKIDGRGKVHLAVGVVEMSVVIAAVDDIKCEIGSTRSKGGDIFSKNFILKWFGITNCKRERQTLSMWAR